MRRAVLVAAILIGAGVRTALLVEKPLWADEIFTLTLARTPTAALLDSLRTDSGPPLHYLLSRLILLPFGPDPGAYDAAVRALSLAASLLHLPLLVLVARRLGRPEAGLPAAALYALFPIAADFGAEGRAYALASLLALAALERALAVRETPTAGRCVALALAAGAAVLCHYLAVFPLTGLVTLVPGASPRARSRLALAGVGGVLVFLPWLPIALRQPPASMAWSRGTEFAGASARFPVNLAWGMSASGTPLAIVLPLSILLLGVALLFAWRSSMRPVASVFLAGVFLLVCTHLAVRSLLLPERPAALFLPLVALLLASAPSPVPLLSAAASLWGLLVTLRAATVPSPGETLVTLLAPEVKSGRSVCAADLWGPELDYRLARAGLPGRVILFPSDVSRHRGWLSEKQLDAGRLAAEARALVASRSRPDLYVLPKGSPSSAALRAALAPLGPRPLASGPLADVLALR
ncbi:MAG: glycosyltransferase family 39 protein [Acidithiobacillales bacterium]